MRLLIPLFLAGPLLGADIGSPVPQPTGDNTADVARIVSYLERSEARSADLAARLDALEARLAALERPAPRTSAPPAYLPAGSYPVNLPPAPPQQVAILPPAGVAANVPPTMPATTARYAAAPPPPAPGPGWYAASYPTASTYTSAPATAPRGATRGGPLGLGILPKLFGSGGGCGGPDASAGYGSVRFAGGGG
jgi:hypothetical protein